MTRRLPTLWPRSLAGRLTLFLVVALALAQAGLTTVLSTQRDRVVEELLHGQALNQTVTLARLLAEYPASDAQRLTAAFGSRDACAFITSSAPPSHTMTSAEQQLANTLFLMLHGVQTAGRPQVAIVAGGSGHHCGGLAPASDDLDQPDHHDDRLDGTIFDDDDPTAVLTVDIPLADARWLAVWTRVSLPAPFDPVTIMSFLLSSIAVAVVVAVVVRHQTRSLRLLANASERFGRGEKVPALHAAGPSEVNAAIHAFNTMQERLSEFIRDRLRLLASVSHDLRTPITTLRLKAELLEDSASRDDLIRTIDELATICESTLAFTRAEATSEDTKVLDLAALVHDVAEEFVLAGKPVDEVHMEAVRCSCRPVALKRAVRNLIENALRYGSKAHVSVLRSDARCIVRIDDEGPGIPSDKLAEAFEPFVRLEPSRNTETGGVGLGLAIARSIVAAHGGRIGLSNLAGGGLRVEVALPMTGQGGSEIRPQS